MRSNLSRDSVESDLLCNLALEIFGRMTFLPKLRNHRARINGRDSGSHVVHSHDSGPVGNVEHCGQNQWAHRQPHTPLQSFPPTIVPRATMVKFGG